MSVFVYVFEIFLERLEQLVVQDNVTRADV